MTHLQRITPYILQPLLAFAYMFGVLNLMTSISSTVVLGVIGASSLGSTAFILFAKPQLSSAKVLHVWGGYAIGIACGLLCYYFVHSSIGVRWDFSVLSMNELGGALSVMMSLLVMCVCRLNHPPAAGMGLGFVMEPWDHSSLLAVFISIVAISIIKKIFHPYLKPL